MFTSMSIKQLLHVLCALVLLFVAYMYYKHPLTSYKHNLYVY